MRRPTMRRLLLSVAFLCALGGSAYADVVNSIPGGTVENMPILNYFGPGPQTVVPGITWTSTNASNQGGSVFGFTDGYGFVGNGSWDSALVMAGLNDSFANYGVVDTMTFSFANPVSAVGGFINYALGFGTPTIAVYNSSGGLIESTVLSFSTGGGTDSGFFYGFQESSNDISSFTLSDAYVGITDLTTASASAPEPSSVALFGTVVALALYFVRRRKAQARPLPESM
ncbi:MAG TPA: PEP-CTERM sorting domain-containing protein [Bryobacteraceae bacterium]